MNEKSANFNKQKSHKDQSTHEQGNSWKMLISAKSCMFLQGLGVKRAVLRLLKTSLLPQISTQPERRRDGRALKVVIITNSSCSSCHQCRPMHSCPLCASPEAWGQWLWQISSLDNPWSCQRHSFCVGKRRTLSENPTGIGYTSRYLNAYIGGRGEGEGCSHLGFLFKWEKHVWS